MHDGHRRRRAADRRDARHHHPLPRRPGARRRRLHPPPRRGPRAHGRERRRQVDADQGAHRRLHHRPRVDHRRRRAARSSAPPPTRRRAGISTVYQEVNLCANLSVGENVMLGHEPRRRTRHRLEGDPPRRRRGHLANLGLRLDTHSLLSSHSIAVQQLVAISRAMVLDARVLILDEPTSSLDRDEVERLFAVIRDLRDQGVAILFVSHFLDQVYEIADRITVLRNGQLVGEYRADDLPRGQLVTKMIGRELDELDGDLDERRARASTAPSHARPARHRRRAARRPRARRPRRLRRRGRRHRRAARLRPHRAGPPALRRRPRRRRAGRGRRRARQARRSPRHAIGAPDRLLVRGPPRRGHRRRPHRRREHRARHPGPARLAAQDPARRAGRRRRRVHRRPSASARPTPTILAGNLSGGNQQKVAARPLAGDGAPS